ncbi:6-phosphogluconate dehydrogenase [Flavobacterium sp.]|uniref:6-phosphogluconate dehydrogenase n=1 Tax=Flavobacterium sp. TaxID=239 RepID=UPI0026229030|nr:6-phosphogluconate dehydrogenase [Flavobacterium sp.]
MLRKIIIYLILSIVVFATAYFSFVYYATYSEGVRSGELIKISSKGVLFKTWEGEISQGISGAQIFKFSVLDKDEKVIEQLKEFQGKYVKVTYIERYRTFPWWGDTNYFVTEVEQDQSPFKMK